MTKCLLVVTLATASAGCHSATPKHPESARGEETASGAQNTMPADRADGILGPEPDAPQPEDASAESKCPDGDLETCLSQAIEIYAIGGEASQRQAMELANEACDLGYAQACVRLGTWLEVGYTSSSELSSAFDIYSKGCELGYASSCYHAGVLLSRPHHYHMPENWPEAFRLLNLACEGGKCSACDELVALYTEGRGGTVDAKRATGYQQRAHELGCE